ncbi:MAG: helix-turn-helix domain-containing protein, partial [Phocaeicola sp.]
MNTRLKQFMAAENITQSQLADSLNVVRASVSHILSGRNNPSYEFIKALMTRYPRLNMEWLMFGKGKMYKDAESL